MAVVGQCGSKVAYRTLTFLVFFLFFFFQPPKLAIAFLCQVKSLKSQQFFALSFFKREGQTLLR